MDSQPALQAFAPLDGGGSVGLVSSVTISVTASASATTQLPGTTGIMGAGLPQQNINSYKQIQIANTSTTVWVYVNIGQQGMAAATVAAGMPVAPGTARVFTINGQSNYISIIGGAAGPTSVVITRGQGID